MKTQVEAILPSFGKLSLCGHCQKRQDIELLADTRVWSWDIAVNKPSLLSELEEPSKETGEHRAKGVGLAQPVQSEELVTR